MTGTGPGPEPTRRSSGEPGTVGRAGTGGGRPLSFAVLAIGVVGAAVVVLALTTLAVAVLPLPPTGKALVALLGIVLAVVAMAVASRRLTARAVRAEFGPQDTDD